MTVRFGLLGAGRIGKVHAKAVSGNPDAVLVAVADAFPAAADAIAKAQLAEVESRLARLTALKAELERMVVQCAGGKIADCRVIEVLGDHSLCATDHRHPETEATQ